MRFYEEKYKFKSKDVRPFAQHTNTNDTNPLHNEKIFKEEVDKVRKSQELKKKEDEKRYREMVRCQFRNSKFMQHLMNKKASGSPNERNIS
jgi:hypothetical protein